MRNLKKILALVLALMMVLSVMATASAADFNDEAEIVYTEAVDVMTTIGMLEGIPQADGTFDFNPKGTLTREGAAKLLAIAILGKADAKVLAMGSETGMSDVPASNWASGYIAWCVQEGMINGYNGKFDPQGTLTGYGWAKLLLCALGIEGTYTGDTWTLDVAINAKNSGLLDGLGNISLSANITREQACQMALNALTYTNKPATWDVVWESDPTNPLGYMGTYDSLVDATMMATLLNGNVGNNTQNTTYTVISTPVSGYLLEEVHYLSVNYDARDPQGRPGTGYTWITGVQAHFFADTPVATWADGKLKNSELYAKLSPVAYTVTVENEYIDGQNNLPGAAKYAINVKDGNFTTAKRFGAYDATIEVYATAVAGSYDVVMYYDYVGGVVAKAGKYDDGTWHNGITGYNGVGVDGQTAHIGLYGADVENFEVYDEVIYTVGQVGATTVICSAVPVKTESGTATWTSHDRTMVTFNGTTYYYAVNTLDKAEAGEITGKATLVFYFNTHGNVVDTYNPAEYSNFAVIEKLGSTQDVFGDYTYYAKLVFADGTVDTVEYYNDNNHVSEGDLVVYESVNNLYFLADAENASVDNGYYNTVCSVYGNDIALEIKTNSTLFDTANGVVANDNTVFVVQTIHPLTGVASYTVYTGIKNVPNVVISGYDAVINGYTYSPDLGYADVIWMYNAVPANHGDNSKLIYVSATSQDKQTDVDRGTYYNYSAIVGGQITELDVILSDEVGSGFWQTAITVNGLVDLENPFNGDAIYNVVTADKIYVKTVGNTIELVDATVNGTPTDMTWYFTADTVIYNDNYGYITEMTVAEFAAMRGAANNYGSTWNVTALAIGNVLTTIVVHL